MSRISGARSLLLVATASLGAMLIGLTAAPAARADSPGPWIATPYSKVRLLSGKVLQNDTLKVLAGVEVHLDEGWKTYWRQPGDGGGIPPTFDWSGSMNIGSIEVLYPAPKRFRNFSSSSVGYKDRVVFPVWIVPERKDEPVQLKLSFSFGICSSICVPVSTSLAQKIETSSVTALPKEVRDALSLVPVIIEKEPERDRARLPRMKRHEISLDGDEPRIVIETDRLNASVREDVFTEFSGDLYLPMARHRPQLGVGAYVIDLSRVEDRSRLRGQTISVTIVSDTGSSLERFTIE